MSISKRTRLRDFKVRGEEETLLDTAYVPVHPFADEAVLLRELHQSAAECLHVDAYWRLFNDVVFVQVWSSESNIQRRVGRYARRNQLSGYVNLVAVVPASQITRPVFQKALKGFLENGSAAFAVRNRKKLGQTLVDVRDIPGFTSTVGSILNRSGHDG